jgi:hypothetical protein
MPAVDSFSANAEGLNAPADNAAAVTPHATNELAYVTRAVWVGGAGNLVVVMRDDSEVTFTNVPAGYLLPIRVKAVRNTSTATNIMALW